MAKRGGVTNMYGRFTNDIYVGGVMLLVGMILTMMIVGIHVANMLTTSSPARF